MRNRAKGWLARAERNLDPIVIVTGSDLPFPDRPVRRELAGLPDPAEILVYTQPEWLRLER